MLGEQEEANQGKKKMTLKVKTTHLVMLEGCQVLAVLLQIVEDHTAVLPQKDAEETIKQTTQLLDAPSTSCCDASNVLPGSECCGVEPVLRAL